MAEKVLVTPTKKPIRRTPVGGMLLVSRRDARLLVKLKLADLVDATPDAQAAPVMSDPEIDPDPGPPTEAPRKRAYRRRDMSAEE